MSFKVTSDREIVLATIKMLNIKEDSCAKFSVKLKEMSNGSGPMSSKCWLHEEPLTISLKTGFILSGKLVYFNIAKSEERGIDIVINNVNHQEMFARVKVGNEEVKNLRGKKLTYGQKCSKEEFGVRVLLHYRSPPFKFTMPDITIELSLEFNEAFQTKQKLQSTLIHDTFSAELPKIKMISDGREFTFDKMLLCRYSDVFKTMLENPANKEAIDGTIEIEDFPPNVIESFERILFLKGEKVQKDKGMDYLGYHCMSQHRLILNVWVLLVPTRKRIFFQF